MRCTLFGYAKLRCYFRNSVTILEEPLMMTRVYLLVFFVLLCLACGDDSDPAPQKEFRLSQIKDGGAVTKIVYADDGKVDSINMTYGDFWSKWVFSYESENIVKVNRYTATDEFAFDRTHIFEFSGDRVVKLSFYAPHVDRPDGYLVQYDTVIYNERGEIDQVHEWTNGSRPDLPIEKFAESTYEIVSEELRKYSTKMRYGVGIPETELHYDNQLPVSNNFFVNFYLPHFGGWIFEYQPPAHNLVKIVTVSGDGNTPAQVRGHQYTYGENGLPLSREDDYSKTTFHYEEIGG